MGSSRFAALDAAARLRAAGLDAAAELASASSPSEPRAGTVAVLISNSGSTPEVLAAAERHRAGSFVIALTGDPASRRWRATPTPCMPLVAERAEAAGIATPLLPVDRRGAGDARRPRRGPDARCRASPAAVPALEALLAGRDAWLSAAADVLDGGSRGPRPRRRGADRPRRAGRADAARGAADRGVRVRHGRLAPRRPVHAAPGRPGAAVRRGAGRRRGDGDGDRAGRPRGGRRAGAEGRGRHRSRCPTRS